jgi:dihydrofolate reductase
MTARISAIAAIGRNLAIGKNNELLWHIKEDLARFKTLTLGHPIIMGRKTFESIIAQLGKALPGRMNIVITRNKDWQFEGVTVVHSVEAAIKIALEASPEEVFIGGGAEIYTAALPFTDRLYLTIIDGEKKGDSFFPPYEKLFTKVIGDERYLSATPAYKFVILER